MVELEQHFDISFEELVKLKELCDALELIEMAEVPLQRGC